ncbi:MAG: bifunctional molybdenum cofactor biosynthesis protein MoaC/MoaB [Leptospirales bacterium]
MIDVTHKPKTLRKASAEGFIKLQKETIEKVKTDSLPKGNLFDVARAAGLLGAKQTPMLIPHCHPVLIDFLEVNFEIDEKAGAIKVIASGAAISRTGIEMEVLSAVSTALLTMYDLLKPVDKQMEITGIRLLDKKGGRKTKDPEKYSDLKAAVLVVSDSTAAGERKDKSGQIIKEMVEQYNLSIEDYQIVPDEIDQIQKQILVWINKDIPFIFTTGGTGLGPRDVTVAAIEEIAERRVEGIGEAMRNYGQERTLKAMLSRSFACTIQKSVVLCLPGSSAGARESLEAILPELFHARRMIDGGGH